MAQPVAVQQDTGQSQRVVWFAHVARALAALMVVFARLIVEFQSQGLVRHFTYTKSLGHVPGSFALDAYEFFHEHFEIDPGVAAVGVFFMLSGFVIPFALERRTLRAFGIRRVLRVYPTLAVATALSIAVVWLTTRGRAFPYDRARITSSVTLTSQYAGQDWIDPSYWTIPIEELFYLATALLAAFRLLRRPAAIVSTAMVLSAASLALGRQSIPTTGPDWAFWTRLYLGRNLGFVTFVFVGVSLHQLYRGFWSRRQFVVVAAIVTGTFFFSLRHGSFQKPFQLTDQANVYFNSYMVGLLVFLVLFLIGNRLPKNRTVEVVGDISYPVYLVGTVFGWTVLVWLTRSFDSYFWAVPVTAAVIFATAYVLHRLVEAPALDVAKRITAQPRYRTQRSWSDPPRRWTPRVAAEPAPAAVAAAKMAGPPLPATIDVVAPPPEAPTSYDTTAHPPGPEPGV